MRQISAIDEYMAKVYRWIIMIVMASVTAGVVNFLTLKGVFGFYQTVGWVPLIIYTIVNLIYDVVGTYLVRHAVVDGVISPKMMQYGKIYFVIVVAQFFFILFLIPSREFWGFAFYFILLVAFSWIIKWLLQRLVSL